LDKGKKIKQILEESVEVEGLIIWLNGKGSLLNNELTKNTCVVRQRQFRVIDLEKRLWLRDESVLLPSGHPPDKITNLEIRMPRCYHLAYTKVYQSLHDLHQGKGAQKCEVTSWKRAGKWKITGCRG
jgi:hypothetical protein